MTAEHDALFFDFQQALAGRYSIDRELGRGGMGVVYLAREVHLDRPVAIKLLPPERAATAGLRERFLREARLAAKLSHPNIIPIHAVEERDGFVFYVMAYIDGETLTQRIQTRGPMSGTDGARMLREVAWALSYAHAQGLVHRDVKPDNILLEHGSGRVLVADFGIAAAAGDDLPSGISGTPEFMSPEQALGGTLDGQSDLYALGATAYFAFSGRLPFEGASATEILAKQVTEAPPPLASLGLSVPRRLALLVDRCLAKAPDQRPAGAQHLAEQLAVALEQRRDVPVVLRAFVKRTGRIDGGGTVLLGGGLAIAASLAAINWSQSAAIGLGVFLASIVAMPLVYMTRAAYRLMQAGYSHQDLAPAFRAEAEQNGEELMVQGGVVRPKGTNLFATIAKASLGVFLVMLGLLMIAPPGLPTRILGTLVGISGPLAAFMTVAHIAAMQRTRDIDTEFWAGLWNGLVGRGAFAVARRLLGSRRLRRTAMTHRATELSLGMAAEELYESLPRETRDALGDLPAVLRQLQEDAQSLRGRYDALQEALGGLRDHGGSDEPADLFASRDLVQGKLGETVAALETIRLNLLRLHAGSGSVANLTTHLELAREVSDGVGRLVEARREVDRMLGFPRLASHSG